MATLKIHFKKLLYNSKLQCDTRKSILNSGNVTCWSECYHDLLMTGILLSN